MLEPGHDIFQHLIVLCSSYKLEEAIEYADKNILTPQSLSSGFFGEFFVLASSILNKNSKNKCILTKLLNIVIERCVYDDVVFELVDASSNNSNVNIFEFILGSFKILFTRTKNEMYLEWCLSLIRSNVEKICIAKSGIDECWDILVNFIKDLIDIHKPISENSKHALISTALYFYRSMYPINYVLSLMRCVMPLILDPFSMLPAIQYCFNKRKENKLVYLYYESVKKKSLAVFMYFVLTDNPMQPQVYSNIYIFEMSLLIVNELLNGDASNRLQGLELLKFNTLRCKESLTTVHLSPVLKSVMEKLSYTMVYGGETNLRKFALDQFDGVVDLFDIKGQYYLFLNLRQELTHSGSIAHVIGKIKKQVDIDRQVHSHYFHGKRLYDLLKSYCFIDSQNIVIDAEKHIASLNLFLYLLLLREKNNFDCPGIYPELKNKFLLPLKKLVDETKIQCQSELDQIIVSHGNCMEINMQLPITNLSQEEKVNGVMVARNAVELVELVLERVLQFWNI